MQVENRDVSMKSIMTNSGQLPQWPVSTSSGSLDVLSPGEHVTFFFFFKQAIWFLLLINDTEPGRLRGSQRGVMLGDGWVADLAPSMLLPSRLPALLSTAALHARQGAPCSAARLCARLTGAAAVSKSAHGPRLGGVSPPVPSPKLRVLVANPRVPCMGWGAAGG